MKKFSIMLAMLLVVALAVPAFANPFTDVPANHWAYEAVNKLVAAGIIQGYPDGTYKGQRGLTRYEIATIVARALDNIASEREALADELDSAKAGLTTAQAQDVTAIVKVLMEKNKPETVETKVAEGITEQQAEEIANLIEALTFEYKAELKVLGANLDVVKTDIAGLDARVAALENPAPAVVTFSGSYGVDFKHQVLVDGAVYDDDFDYYWFNNPDGKAPAGADLTDSNLKKKCKDSYVYTDPWDDDSDKIDIDEDKSIDQTLDLATQITKNGFTADLNLDVAEDDDEYEIDSMSLSLENDFMAAVYNEENGIAFTDYAFNDSEINGASVNFKKYGLNTFFGKEDVAVGKKDATVTKKAKIGDNGYMVTGKKDVVKYKWDKDKNKFVAKTKDEKDPFYVFGAQKTFKVADMDLNTIFVSRRAEKKDTHDDFEVNLFGVNTATELADLDLNFDLAYSMPKDDSKDNGYLVRFGLAKELDLAGLEFNYKNSDKDFMPLDQDDVVFDSGDDDYELYTTGVAKGTSGWNFTVKPHLMDNLETSIFYASVNDPDDKDNTKLALKAEMPFFIDGLTLNSKYETTKEDTDEEKTTGFGAEYTFLADKATATFDYEIVNPVENETPVVTVPVNTVADKKENTLSFGLKYAFTDYVSANFDYDSVTNLDNLDKLQGKDMKKTTTGFGVELTKYPLFDALTTSAGLNYENIEGNGYDYDKDEATINVDNLEEKTTKYNVGLAYTLGAADLSYDYAYTKKDGVGVGTPGEGNYTTNKVGLVYNITDDVDFTADYEILKLDAKKEYEVKTATAGVSLDF